MRSFAKQPFLGAALTLGLAFLVAGSACAVEDGLLGVRIGASSRQLLADAAFGQPDGILFPSGGGLLYQQVGGVSGAGLPDFVGQQTAAEPPYWVFPVRASALTEMRLQWVYDFTKSKGVALGVVFDTGGGDAVVTDVIVAGYPERLAGKPVPLRTQRGVILGSTFSDVLKRYGYPPLIEIYAPTTGGAAAAGAVSRAGGGMRAGVRAARGGGMRAGGMRGGGMRGGGMRGGGMRGGGMRGGMRGGVGMGGAGRRGGRFGALPTEPIQSSPSVGATVTAQSPELELVLTAAPGRGRRGGPGMRGGMGGGPRGGGMRGGGMRGGGMRGGMRGAGMRGGMRGGGAGGRGGLPPLGTRAPAAAAPVDRFTAQATVDHVSVGFSRDCILTYEGIAFTLHDMKVVRIHVSE